MARSGVQKEQLYVNLIGRMKRKEAPLGKLTLGEVTDLAEEFKVKASDVVIAEAMEAHRSLNRGGGRIKLVDAKPSLGRAIQAAERLGIKLAQN